MIKLPETEVTSRPRGYADALCKDLIEGMHAASQPLTILRATLGSPEVKRQSVEDLRKLVRRMSKEVERLCVLFNYLQQFVIVESIKAESENSDLHQLMNHALEGVDLLFAEAGVGLTVRRESEADSFVLVDSSRLEHALSSILIVVLGRVQRGDEVTVKTNATGARIDIATVTVQAPACAMGAEDKLNMALAAANLRSQGAQMAWEEQPLTVQISLPEASPLVAA